VRGRRFRVFDFEACRILNEGRIAGKRQLCFYPCWEDYIQPSFRAENNLSFARRKLTFLVAAEHPLLSDLRQCLLGECLCFGSDQKQRLILVFIEGHPLAVGNEAWTE